MQHEIVSKEQWVVARRALLAKEKAMTRARDQLSAERRELPWVRIDKPYFFDGPEGRLSLSDLFAGRSQLFIKHFMMGPGQQHHCVGCSFELDNAEGVLVHLENHDVSYVAVARAPIVEIEALKARMGWRARFVSSYGSDFNFDFNVSYTPEQLVAKKATYNFGPLDFEIEDLSGDSVFYKDDNGQIFLTYANFGRGSEMYLGAYGILDAMPKGRNENGTSNDLTSWVRPHDMYGKGGMVEPTGRYHPADCGCGKHV
ncbi:putative dithiol-disulfide oxidoreductase (DUF899 family) [Aminobacter niigataensis]|uniref:Dithiol-disulfide oxidoreductase (DUF899 family) n=1 Tax=Aminobacter niigataensis TaxID=83265 RepID=A0ABR6L6V0_9HYPH|nr:thioredoxin family protein [Aminobacter niigataensis]MBB4652523.1 putative dithiol-disulfide oxidoreductase (DUF899 family) [Aminobacter niigataensis]